MSFPVNAREGNPYKTRDGKTVKISDTVQKISAAQTQAEALSDLGISFEDNRPIVKVFFLCWLRQLLSNFSSSPSPVPDFCKNSSTLKIQFYETGNPYAEPEGDRTKTDKETTQKVCVEFKLDNPPPRILDIKAYLEPFTVDSVNFAGKIELTTPSGEKRSIPMTGRGTAALEGQENDAHAGFCTGATCATFQERTALVLGVAAAAGANNQQLQEIGENLRPLNEKFHGRDNILTYTIKASQTPEDKLESYTEFMKARYPKGEGFPLLKNVIDTGELNDAYYKKAEIKMTPEELREDKETR